MIRASYFWANFVLPGTDFVSEQEISFRDKIIISDRQVNTYLYHKYIISLKLWFPNLFASPNSFEVLHLFKYQLLIQAKQRYGGLKLNKTSCSRFNRLSISISKKLFSSIFCAKCFWNIQIKLLLGLFIHLSFLFCVMFEGIHPVSNFERFVKYRKIILTFF